MSMRASSCHSFLTMAYLRVVMAKTKTYAPSAGRKVKACVRSDQLGTFLARVASHAKNGVVRRSPSSPSTFVLAWCLLCRLRHHEAELPLHRPSKKCCQKKDQRTPHSRWPPMCCRKPQCAQQVPTMRPHSTGAYGEHITDAAIVSVIRMP